VAEVIRYINQASTAGGDGTTNATSGANRAYATFSEWQAAEATNMGGTDWHHVIATGTGEMVDSFAITGWGASDFVLIEVAEGSRGDGTPQSGLHLKKSLGFDGIVTIGDTGNIYIIGLDVENTHASGWGFFCNRAGTGRILLKNCIAKVASNVAFRMSGGGANTALMDSIAYDSAEGIITPNWYPFEILNSTFKNCTDGIKKSGTSGTGRTTVKNTVVIGGTNKYATPLADHFNTGSSSNNATDAAVTTDVPGSSAIANVVTGDFTDYATNDLSLHDESALQNAGTSLVSDYGAYDRAEFVVTESDIIGTSRPQGGVWDIGAFELFVESSFQPVWAINSNRVLV
jgi:hypothetical protein